MYKQNKFQGEELAIYDHHLANFQRSYAELTMVSKKRLVDLQKLQEFIHSAMTELTWLNEKEKMEMTRDWSSKLLNLIEIQSYYEVGFSLPFISVAKFCADIPNYYTTISFVNLIRNFD